MFVRTNSFVQVVLSIPLFFVLLLVGCQPSGQEDQEERFIDPRSQTYLRQGGAALDHHEFDIALAYADSARMYTPELPDAEFLRGRVYSELGHFDKAEAAYLLTLKRSPDYRGVWHNLANNAFRQHQYKESVGYYHKEIKQNPAPIPWRGLGRAYVELGNIDSARIAFEQALTMDSTYAPAHFNLALLQEDEGDFETALLHAKKASVQSPADLDFRYLMASLMVTNDLFEDAIQHLKHVTEAWPWHHASHYKLGQSLIRIGDNEAGQALLTRAETLRAQDAKVMQLLNSAHSAPNDPLVHAALGSALRRAGRYEDAMRAYKVARYLDPANLEVQTNMANLMLIQGDTLSTIQGYRAILQQDPTFTGIWVNLGIVYAMSGLNEQARDAWEKALVLEPDHAAAKTYIARLDK